MIRLPGPFLAAILCAATARLAAVGPQMPVFRTGVDVVRVDALVTDGGRPVSGLTAADFEVTDNGVAQDIQLATTAGNVKVVLVLDTSGSVVGEKLQHLKAASRALLRAMRAGDTAALLTFSERIALHVAEAREVAVLEKALDRVEAGGSTALRDAIFAGLSFAAPDTVRTLLILFSDGLDNASWLSRPQLLDSLKHSMVVVYSVDASSNVAGSNLVLEQVAETSGGEYLSASAGDRLGAVFVGILQQFRARYLLTYTPQGVKRNDGWHTLKVRLKGKKGQVRARSGYFAR